MFPLLVISKEEYIGFYFQIRKVRSLTPSIFLFIIKKKTNKKMKSIINHNGRKYYLKNIKWYYKIKYYSIFSITKWSCRENESKFSGEVKVHAI
jgi:hypothetical protein